MVEAAGAMALNKQWGTKLIDLAGVAGAAAGAAQGA